MKETKIEKTEKKSINDKQKLQKQLRILENIKLPVKVIELAVPYYEYVSSYWVAINFLKNFFKYKLFKYASPALTQIITCQSYLQMKSAFCYTWLHVYICMNACMQLCIY